MIAVIVFCIIPVVVGVFAAVSFLPSLGAPKLPSFDDPVKVSTGNFSQSELDILALILHVEWPSYFY